MGVGMVGDWEVQSEQEKPAWGDERLRDARVGHRNPAIMRAKILVIGFALLVLFLYVRAVRAKGTPDSGKLGRVRDRLWPVLVNELKKEGFRAGAPAFVRIFKDESVLEVWLRDEIGGRYRKFSSYRIATYGGGRLGPKLKEGDGVAPEGFYFVGAKQLHPGSKYHLAFNLGYPNGFDRSLGRTGSALMVHGDEVSVGCYAMTDPQIEMIYLLMEAALRGKQDEIQVQIFPFRMSEERLARETGNEWHGFWKNLQEGYDLFERERVPPLVGHRDGKYVFRKMTP
jgi:murein L,D-transpeptidase YafK